MTQITGAAGGDIAAGCMALMAEDNACQVKTQTQGVQVRRREVRRARELRQKLIEQIRAAQKKAGFWSKLGGILSKIAAAATVALSVAGGPAAAAVLAGAVATGGCRIGSTVHGKDAARAEADKLQVEHDKAMSEEGLDDLVRGLDEVADIEARMFERIQGLLDSEQQVPLS